MKHMLIVDKVERSRKVLTEIFQDKYPIIEAENSAQAIDIVNKRSKDIFLVLIDMCDSLDCVIMFLDEMNKLDLLNSIPVIAVTGPGISEVDVLRHGAWDYVSKPFHPDVINMRVENAIDKLMYIRAAANKAKIETKEQVLNLINGMPVPYVVLKYNNENDKNIGSNFKINYCNKSYAKLYGEDYKDIIGTSFTEFNDEDVLLDLCKKIASSENNNSTTTIELKKDGRVYSINLYSPKKNYCSLVFNDITNSKCIQKEYVETLVRENKLLMETNKQRERYELISAQTEAAIFEWNYGDNNIYASGNLKAYKWNNDISIESLNKIENIRGIHPEDKETLFYTFVKGVISGEKQVRTTLRIEKITGEYIWCKVVATCFHDNDGKLIRIIATLKDVNQEIEYLNRLKRDAEYDLLTGLYNRNTFYTKVRKMIKANKEVDFSIICFDINKFKLVNGIFGRNEGDRLLVYISQKLSEILNEYEYNICGRFDADVFCICLPTINVEESVETFEHLLDNYKINFNIVVSLGIYNIENKNISIDIMCDKARLALSTIKGNYLVRHISFDEKMNDILINEQEIINNMNTALTEEQFEVYYQPHYQLSSYKMCGAEALVRWVHPTKGMIFPNEFIPLFERNGFIMKLDEYVWEKVCIFLRNRLDEGKVVTPVSVNISKVNIYNPRLCDIVLSLIEKYNIPPNLFQVEITETAYTENKSSLLEVIKRWQEKGIIVMMDDFGSGYSSLNMLKDISVDVLKIDLRFLDGRDESGKGKSIMSSVIRMAKWLNMYVISEGVETKEQADFLRNIGCEYAQGYFFARPMPMHKFEELLDSNKNDIIVEHMHKGNNFDLIKSIWLNETGTNMIFNNSMCAMGIYEVCNGKIEAVSLNDEYFNLHGITRERFSSVEIHILDWIVEEDRSKTLCLFNEAFINNGVSKGTITKRLPNGKKLYLKITVKFIMGDIQNGIYISVLTDVTKEKQIEKKLEETNIEMAMILQTTPTAIVKFKWDAGLSILYANDFFYKLLGYTKESYYAQNGDKLEAIIPMSFYNEINTEFQEVVKNRGSKLFKKIRVLASDGSYRHLMSGNGFVYNGDKVKIFSTNLDITDLVNTEEKLQISTEQLKQRNLQLNDKYKRERQLREIVSANAMIYCEIDLIDNILLDGYEKNLLKAGVQIGDKGSSFLRKISNRCIHNNDLEAFQGAVNISNLLNSYKSGIYNIKQELRLNLYGKDDYTWAEIVTTMFESQINGHICCTITGKDISAVKQYEQALIDKSEKDQLTGLYNAVKFKKAVANHIEKYKNGVFYMLDIDDFKLINDKYGHGVGDNLIISVAHALSSSLPSHAIIARTGGDEYAAFVGVDISKSQAVEYAEAICREIRNKAPDKSMLDCLTCSLGVSTCGGCDICSYDRLYANADKAMYLAKQSGKNKYVFYENSNIKKDIKILLADDRNIRRSIIVRLLTDKYNIIETISGLTFLEKAHEYGKSVSVVIIDSTLPDITGLSVVEELQKDETLCNIPVIMLTKETDTELKRKAKLLGVECFIDKPIEAELLLRSVERIIERASTGQCEIVL